MEAAQQAMEAAGPLENASDLIEPLAAGLEGNLPPQAQQAFDEAVEQLIDAIANAEANNPMPAQQASQQAQNAIAQAAAALAAAQQGQQPGQQPGQGQPGQQPGQGKPGEQPGKGEPSERADGNKGNFDGKGGADGPRNGTAGTSGFLSLPKREREALLQSRQGKTPAEYDVLVKEFLKRLSDSPKRDLK
jgi:hypothetical protein